MSKISPLAPLLEIHSLPLDLTDLIVDQVEYGTPDVGIEFLQSFDDAWLNIINERGSFAGKHESKIAILQSTAVKLKKSKDDVKSELKTQTLFIRNNRDTMESKFEQQIQETTNRKMSMDEKLNEKIKLIHKLTSLTETTMHWHHFNAELDKFVTTPNSTSRKLNKAVASNNICYSDRARTLTYLYQKMDGKQKDVKLVEHRAVNVENALLKTQLKMLKLEIERCKVTTLLQQEMALALKDINKA
jgi:vacuolar-type H+-ATPase subunit I/STV1